MSIRSRLKSGRILSALVAFLTLPAAPHARRAAAEPAEAETRRERWERLRREKAEALRPPRPGVVERSILALEKAERPGLLAWNVGGFYPRLRSIGWGSQTAIGARFWQPDIGGTKLDVHAAAFHSIRRYESYELQAGLLPHRGRALPARSATGDDVYELGGIRRRGGRQGHAYASLRYRHLPEVDFYGLGTDSRPEDHTTFLLQDAWYDLVAGYQHTARAVVTARAGLMQAFVGPGRDDAFPATQERFHEAQVPGLARQPDFLHLTLLALLDGRDQPHNPHAGGMLALSASRFDDRDGDLYRFDRLAADARAFLPLGSAQRVVALRALVSADRPAEGSRVPFFLQETLGGSHTLRGYRSFRFRGEKLVLLQAEYRWEAAPAVELAAFLDGGRVASHLADWSLRDLRTSYGLGLRIKTHDQVLLRFDVGRSSEETRFLLRVGPSF
ncbi:MAG TPA: BamA/TamA family outer membrane protein [Vicinamibacteria bacterium]|nr:BamA/TamA family outer membrane protein [Vicinamibacteria bacterium]